MDELFLHGAAHRRPVDLPRAYRLMNHGPTVLVSAAHEGRANVMAAAWAMPLDFDPPKVAVVVDKSTFTRGLIEASGRFALSVPCVASADAAFAVGSTTGATIDDKFSRFGLDRFEGTTGLPLPAACVAWLECRLMPEPHIQQAYDLFLGEVVAAQADDRVFRDGRWHLDDAPPGLRTLHHVAGGAFITAGPMVQARQP